MKAWRVYGVGDMRLDEMPRPAIKPDCVVLRIRMLQLSVTEIQMFLQGDSLAGHDWEERCKTGPIQLFGHEFCGQVVEVGEEVHDLKIDDRVFWGRTIPCGHCALCTAGYEMLCQQSPHVGYDIPGCLAEYALIPAGLLMPVPISITDSEVAALQPLDASVGFVAAADIELGDVVAVLGQGVMGLSCLQLIRYAGASKLIGVDVRTEALTLSKQLGADVVINASEVDPVQAIKEVTGGIGADVVFECAGGSAKFGLAGSTTLAVATRVVRDGGKVILVGQHDEGTGVEIRPLLARGIQYRGTRRSSPKQNNWAVELVASKRVQLAPMITHVLEGIDKVPQAIEMTANKRKYGVLNPVQVKIV